MVDAASDERLLTELLGLLTRLERDRARMADGPVGDHGTPAFDLIAGAVNALVAFATARSSDRNLLPSRMLSRLAETHPYTQLLGEEDERMTVSTAAALLKDWKCSPENRRQFFLDVCGALVDVLALYGNALSAFFHGSVERDEWRATFELFLEDLRAAVQQIEIPVIAVRRRL